MDRATKLLRIAEHVGAAARSPNEWKPALRALVELFRGDHAVIAAHGKDNGETIVTTSAGLDDDQIRRSQSPNVVRLMQPYLQALPTGAAVTRAQVMPDREFQRTTLCNDVLQPMNGFHAAAARFESTTTSSVIAVCRRRGPGNFGSADTAALQALLPHFMASLELHRQLRGANLRVADLAAALDSLQDGVILTDATARPVFLNVAASRIIAERDCLLIDSGHVSTADRVAARRVQKAISTVARGTTEECHLHLDRPQHGTRLYLTLLPAYPLAVGSSLPGAARVAVFIKEQGSQANVDSVAVAEIFKLTRRESETTALLAAGLRPAEIAARLGVGYNTVRSHLSRAFEKTGAHSQVELIAAVRNTAGKTAD